MDILPVHQEILDYLKIHRLEKKFYKQLEFLKLNLRHPGLSIELLEPKHLKFYSFRIDRKYRAIFIFRRVGLIEILDANNHYK